MMTLQIAAVALILSLWVIASIIYARPRDPKELSKYGPFGLLIPSWNFFAPHPGVHDYHLLYRDQLVNGSVGPWRDISGFATDRPWWTLIWNPMKIQKKALFDLINVLISELPENEFANENGAEKNLDLLKLTVPYISLLIFVSNIPSSPLTIARQFMVMRESTLEETVETLLISGLHKLDEE